MFKIKICGIGSEIDLLAVLAAGADAVGLNFYRASRRYVEPVRAGEWSELAPELARVGLFVNSDAAEIAAVADQVPLDFLQLHGDEPLELLKDLPPIPVIRAFRCPISEFPSVRRYLQAAVEQDTPIAGYLMDAHQPGSFGGTGTRVDWEALAAQIDLAPLPCPLILAGGLTPSNVASAIRAVRPAGVDTASGVEVRAGEKDAELVTGFVQEARAAFASLASR